MARPIYTTISSATTSRVVNLDMNQSPFNVAIAVTGSSSGTFTYGVEYTYDDQQSLTNIGSTRAPVWQFSTFLTSATAANGEVSFSNPIAAVRLTASAISSASLTMAVLQGGPA